ncbi:phosphoserine phosphatase SerB [Arthrobacter sp. NPDC090010]|uniref:phosphoserine phosphatase SerB n=1 Tax=Arthrobacter sp. NPDC090010 TaxID=3363942 RepID=UPI00382A18BC
MQSHFTALAYAPELTLNALDQVAEVIGRFGAVNNPWTPIPADGFSAAELAVTAPSEETAASVVAEHWLVSVREALAQEELPVDVAVVPSALRHAERKFLIMDVDSTLIQQEVIELIAAHAGKEAEVAAVTEAAMRGELDFAQSLHQRVAQLAGLPVSVLDEVRDAVRLSVGARRLVDAFHAQGHQVAVVSGGFSQVLEPIAQDLGLDHWLANDLEIQDGVLTGRVAGDVVDRATKAGKLREWAQAAGVPLDACFAVGDGANDLDMLATAGLGIAFNAKPAVQGAAGAAINQPHLDAVAVLAGVPLA